MNLRNYLKKGGGGGGGGGRGEPKFFLSAN